MADVKMRKILFTVAAVWQTVPPVKYVAGQVETLREDLATRWLGRGVATDDAELIAKAEAATKAGTGVEIIKEAEKLPDNVPANWRSLNARESIALAVVLGAKQVDVQTRAQATGFIEQKVAEANPAADV